MNSHVVAGRGVSATTPTKNHLFRACIVWGFATLFFFFDNLLQVSPSAMKPELSLAFVKDAEQFGSLSAYCLYAYGLMQIPAGIFMDRFGPRRILTMAAIFCSLGSFLFGIAGVLWEAKMGRVMIGIGASFALVGCLKLANHWFSSGRFALMTGLTVTIGYLGAVFSLSMVSKIVELFGWRDCMTFAGGLGFFISFLLWTFIRDYPKDYLKLKNHSDAKIEVQTESQKSSSFIAMKEMLRGLWEVFQHKQTWVAALFAGLMFVPTLAFGGLWGIPFLVEAHGFDRAAAGQCVSLIYVGWVVGSPCWGFFSDYLKRRNLPMMIASIITLIVCLAIIYIHPLSLTALSLLLFSLGFFSSGFILAFAVVQESNPDRIAGTAIGFTNALNTLWGALAQPIIGIILDMNAAVSIDQSTGERIFSLMEYQHALIALPVSLILSFILLLFLKETNCRPKV